MYGQFRHLWARNDLQKYLDIVAFAAKPRREAEGDGQR
jgi:hypothetical protein